MIGTTEDPPLLSTAAAAESDLVHVSTPLLLLSTTPLALIAVVSRKMKLNLEQSIAVGTVRTFVQLSICGWILHPTFLHGIHPTGRWLAHLCVIFVIVVASLETSQRSKCTFDGMFPCVLAAFFVNIAAVSIFAFGIIVHPTPVCDPKCVIPVTGMLLGNCINGVALALDDVLTSFKESAAAVELWLAFGGDVAESAADVLRTAVRWVACLCSTAWR
jgi:putative ABC transport system permease protein